MTDIVIDASAFIDHVADPAFSSTFLQLPGDAAVRLHAPACFDPEVLSHASRARRGKRITRESFNRVAMELAHAPIARHDRSQLTIQAAKLCDVVSAYDAFYVALAQLLNAALLTSDKRLARAVARSVPGLRVITSARAAWEGGSSSA